MFKLKTRFSNYQPHDVPLPALGFLGFNMLIGASRAVARLGNWVALAFVSRCFAFDVRWLLDTARRLQLRFRCLYAVLCACKLSLLACCVS